MPSTLHRSHGVADAHSIATWHDAASPRTWHVRSAARRALPPRSPRPGAIAAGWHARTTRTSRSPVGCCRGDCGRTFTTSTPTAAGPTTWPTKPRDPARACDCSTGGRRSSTIATRGDAEHPVFVALAETIAEFEIPARAVCRSAGGLSPGPARHALRDARRRCWTIAATRPIRSGGWCCTWAAATTSRARALSDSICTGLQLANFCQDVARDWAQGPRLSAAADAGRAPATTEAMFAAARLQRRVSPVRCAVEVDRAERYLLAGQPLVDWCRAELRLRRGAVHRRRAGDSASDSPARLRRLAHAARRSRSWRKLQLAGARLVAQTPRLPRAEAAHERRRWPPATRIASSSRAARRRASTIRSCCCRERKRLAMCALVRLPAPHRRPGRQRLHRRRAPAAALGDWRQSLDVAASAGHFDDPMLPALADTRASATTFPSSTCTP